MEITELKKARVAVLISNHLDFETKTVTKGKDKHYIIIKEAIQQEDIIIVMFMHPTCEQPNT